MFLTQAKRVLSFILCAVLIAAMALITTGCSDNKKGDDSTLSSTESTAISSQVASSDGVVLGEGKTAFKLVVTYKDGKQTEYTIQTDKEMVGDALTELNFIDGEQGDYGLYIKSVNGITADYDVDKTYWAFYIDGEYALTGIDMTKIAKDTQYELRVEKG